MHVCQRWRDIVFGSPSGLELRLVYTTKTPARETLDVWPALPLCIRCDGEYQTGSVDNIIAVLERRGRVVEINFDNIGWVGWDLNRVFVAMLKPFPELTDLDLIADKKAIIPILPDSFLGGSVPRLDFLTLDGIPFPGLPKLLLSATYVVDLYIKNIPCFGYFSPDAMLTALSTLTSLKHLQLGFDSLQYRPSSESRRPHPLTHPVLPALTHFWFRGASEYLEDLVAHIDAPQLSHLGTAFFNEIVFNTPQLVQFIYRTSTLKSLEKATVVLKDGTVTVKLRQISSMEQGCTPSPPLSTSEAYLAELYIYTAIYLQPDWPDNTLWLELLHPFAAVKNLCLSEEFAPRIVLVLQELVGGRTTGVLPILQNIFLEGLRPSGPVQEAIGQFVAARQVAGHPIIVTRWERELKKKNG